MGTRSSSTNMSETCTVSTAELFLFSLNESLVACMVINGSVCVCVECLCVPVCVSSSRVVPFAPVLLH